MFGDLMKYKTYPKMKDSGIEWIGKIPEHWNVYSIRILGKIDLTISNIQNQSKKLNEFSQALISNIISGKICVTN